MQEVIITATPLRSATQDNAMPAHVLSGDDLIRARASSVGETLAEHPALLFIRGSNLLDEDARRHASPLKDHAPLPGRSLGAGVRFEF